MTSHPSSSRPPSWSPARVWPISSRPTAPNSATPSPTRSPCTPTTATSTVPYRASRTARCPTTTGAASSGRAIRPPARSTPRRSTSVSSTRPRSAPHWRTPRRSRRCPTARSRTCRSRSTAFRRTRAAWWWPSTSATNSASPAISSSAPPARYFAYGRSRVRHVMTRNDHLRARDTDRVEVCALIDAALRDGQLTEDEHAGRTRSAMRATTFGELNDLIRDLQIPDDLAGSAVLHRDRPQRRWWIPVAVLAIAAVIGATAGTLRPEGSSDPLAVVGVEQAEQAEAEPAPLPSLVTGSGFALFVDSYRREFGDAIADTVTVMPEYAVVQRLKAGRPVLYRFDAEGFQASGSSTVSWANGRPVDLGAIDLTALAGILRGAPESVRLPGGVVKHLGIEYELSAPADAGPVIRIFVGDGDDRTGHMVVDLAAKPVEIFPAD
ncbi:DUF1707 domain-containing protein [Nocardia cyriacigeorgica]|uniref:DUF1707 domain-containing protein n=2 Tax=Nocardia cyriacigeorgica TaxID=135487 RepID=A0A5R8NSQ9_9NOCA|nr:DUF1707 domain-containing protein [Nocardia cyriacigeorgica]